MFDIDLSILGDRGLERKINKLENKVAKKLIRDAAKEAMEPVAVMARVRAPVLDGRLKASIKVITYSARRGRITGAQVKTGSRFNLRIPANAKYYYPAAHEYGAPKRGIKMRSFLRSSLTDLRSSVIFRLGKLIAKGLEKT